mgnify:CR=1 FL=1
MAAYNKNTATNSYNNSSKSNSYNSASSAASKQKDESKYSSKKQLSFDELKSIYKSSSDVAPKRSK